MTSSHIKLLAMLVIALAIPQAGLAQGPIRYPLESSQPEVEIANLPANLAARNDDYNDFSDLTQIDDQSWDQEPPGENIAPGPLATSIDESFSGSTGQVFDSPAPEFQLVTPMQIPTIAPTFFQPANQSLDGSGYLQSYNSRTELFRDLPATSVHQQYDLPQLPDHFRAWWTDQVTTPVGLAPRDILISIDSLIQNALRHSPHIQIAAVEPHIRREVFLEESAQFDWYSFLETKYDDQNDPIGNTLTTGNNDRRFKQQEWTGTAGVRRKNRVGGEYELSQKIGHMDNNSRFLVPRNQGSSRLELNYRQPLLNGRGRAVNESVVVLADIDFQTAGDDYLENLQQHLLGVTEAYWELVRSRAEFFQRLKLLQSAEQILANLSGRAEVDALYRQVLRAKAAVANRRAEIARSLTSIRNAESRLRLLVNDPALINSATSEFTPTDIPNLAAVEVNMADALSTALANRPDISRAIRELKAANVRCGVAKNDVLPKLDLLVGTYVAGLDENYDVFDSWSKQFEDGRPGFNVGLNFEIPIGNRAAQAREQRQEWELTRAINQFRVVVETSMTEVELAAREVTTTHKEMVGRYHAMIASEQETSFLVDRWQTLPGLDDTVTLLLEDLLDSQERLADEEAAFVKAQVEYSVATVRLKQAMGTLFQVENNQ